MPVASRPLGLANARASAGTARLRVVRARDFGTPAAWDRLTAQASEPNPFFESWCLGAAVETFDRDGEVFLALLERDENIEAVMPLAKFRQYGTYLLPHLANWLHANAFCGTPLIARGAERAFWRELLDWADEHAEGALFLHLHELPEDGPSFRALCEEVRERPRPAAVVKRTERAMLASDRSPQAYFEQSLSAKKRKELRRQLNRLGDEGEVAFERRCDRRGLDGWIGDFLALEARGWKGSRGSALASSPDTARFFRAALRGAADNQRLERLTLSLDGRPIALLANFIAPPGAFCFKTTFDEGLARFSPGVLLQRENLGLLSREEIDWTDSCAAEGHPMIERIWREKRTILRVSLGIGGGLRRTLCKGLLRAETGAYPKGLG